MPVQGSPIEPRAGVGWHVCAVCSPADRAPTIAEFIGKGILQGQKALYVFARSPAQGFFSALVSNGIDPLEALESGRLQMVETEALLARSPIFSLEEVLQMLRDSALQACQEGFQGLAVVGEMEWVLGARWGLDILWRFEEGWNTLAREVPISAICLYAPEYFGPDSITRAIQTHPYEIRGGLIFPRSM